MAATRLISMNRSKALSLFHSIRLNPVNKLSMAGVSATDNFSKSIEEFGRALGFPIGGGGGNLNEKPQFESFNPSILSSTLADQFRVDVRGRPVISDEEDDDDEFDDDEGDSEFCGFDDDDGEDEEDDDDDNDDEK